MPEYDDQKIEMTQDLHVGIWVSQAPRYDYSKAEPIKIVANASDGPQIEESFNPDMTLLLDDHNPGTLAHAVHELVNKYVKYGIRCEAEQWVREHDDIYIVVGTTGKGPTVQQWCARAFLNSSLANAWCQSANDWCLEFNLASKTPEAERARIIDPSGQLIKCTLDPRFRIDDGGAEYSVVSAPLDMTNAWR